MDFETRLARWLRAKLLTASEEGVIHSIVVRHIAIGGKAGQEVETFDLPAKLTDEVLTDLGNDIWLHLQADSLGLPGDVQSYAIQAMRKTKVCSRLTIRMNTATIEGEGYDSEPASAAGQVAQAMRHTEFFAKVMTQGQLQIMTIQERMLDRMAKNQIEHEEQRRSNIELQEALLTGQHERDMDLAAEDRRDRTSSELLRTLKILGPAVVNRLGKGKNGTKLLPEAKSPKELALEALVDSMTDEQRANFVGNLDDTQKIALAELLQPAAKPQ